MPPKSPVTVARNLNGPGVLPVNPAALQTPPAKSSLRLKLEIRRLPPSLTKDEFQDAFGDEWRVGAGKIDWLEYRPGKVKSPGKPSEQSRAYVHVTNEAYIKAFEAKFLSIAFQDAKGSHRDPNLKGLPPTLGFAPNQRIPNQKQRVDGRQGTIDQDPEFIAFLEAETQPVVKPAALDTATEKPKDKVTSTPLIDDLREKKANKAKAAAAKPAKPARAESKDDKAAEKKTGKAAKVAGDGGAKGANKLEHATKDAVKVLNKQAAKARAASPAPAKQAASPSPAPDRKRERVTPNAIKNMLQRDLGLNQPSKRGAKQAAAAAENTATSSQSGPAASTAAPQATGNQRNAKAPRSPKTERKTPLTEKANGQSASSETTKPAPAAPTGILKKPQPAQHQTPKGPRGRAAASPAPSAAAAPPVPASPSPTPAPTRSAANTPNTRAPRPAPPPTPGATRAYLKHANASQGITEGLLLTALSSFGQVVKVEIDKRKGTALAEFADHEGFRKALEKKSVPVAQGAVEMLEFREKAAGGGLGGGKASGADGGRGRGGGFRGRGGRGSGGGRGGMSAAAGAVGQKDAGGAAPAGEVAAAAAAAAPSSSSAATPTPTAKEGT